MVVGEVPACSWTTPSARDNAPFRSDLEALGCRSPMSLYIPVQGGSFFSRLCTQLCFQYLFALPVLAQSGFVPSAAVVELHQNTVGAFARGIESEPAACVVYRNFKLSLVQIVPDQPVEDGFTLDAQDLGLGEPPLIETRAPMRSETGKKISAA